MAIIATIQHRHGAEEYFKAEKMVTAELAVTDDGTDHVYIAFEEGRIEELALKKDITPGHEITDEQIQEAVNKYLEENPVTATELYMRVSDDGYIQFSQDNASWKNVIAVSELKGGKGDTGIGIASVEQTVTSTEDGGENVIRVTKTDETFSEFSVRNGSKGKPGYTPVKGTDYYTEADKTEMVQAVLEALPRAEEVTW